MQGAFKQGRQAAKEGRRGEDNPYDRLPATNDNTNTAALWDEGYYSHEPLAPIKQKAKTWQ